MYEIQKITFSLEGNYIKILTDQSLPKGDESGLPLTKNISAYYPKSSTGFSLNYALINDGKAESWSVESVEIFHRSGQNRFFVMSTEINSEKVFVDGESSTLENLLTYLTKNTGA